MNDEAVVAAIKGAAPGVLASLMRRYDAFDACEDAVQEALIAAMDQWPVSGMPEYPSAWLRTVASRRLIDRIRQERARRSREQQVSSEAATIEPADVSNTEDTLALLMLCCHQSLSVEAQTALTLRAVGGLATASIARAFMVTEATMTRRITRAKETIRCSGGRFTDDVGAPTPAVLHVLYLLFHHHYMGIPITSPDDNIASDAIRLTRHVHIARPMHAEAAGLLALMLLSEARRPARFSSDGMLVPLDIQDRSLWDASLINEGVQLLSDALKTGSVGQYQLEAAIAAVHDESPTFEDTDWTQIDGLYTELSHIIMNPLATVNHAIARAKAQSPAEGFALLSSVENDTRVHDHYLFHAAIGHLYEIDRQFDLAITSFEAAADRAIDDREKHHLLGHARRLRKMS